MLLRALRSLSLLVASLLVLSALVLVHEAGHFVAARALGIGVHEAAIGFGPALTYRTIHGTRYSARVLPLGGFVSLVGETPFDVVPPDQVLKSFRFRPAWQRALVVLAGPLASLLLVVPLGGLAMRSGVPRLESLSDPVVGVEIVRDGFLAGAWRGLAFILVVVATTWRAVWGLMSGRAPLGSLAGPAGVLALLWRSLGVGSTGVLLAVAGGVSAALGATNLLPVPPLDGGSLVQILVESVRGELFGKLATLWWNGIGVLFFFVLLGISVYADVRNWGSKESAYEDSKLVS
jgi:membrane-associated protease RseP (regulator of RpoE activity)